MEEALSIRKHIYGRNHPRFARGLYYLAMAEMKCGKFETAVSDFEYAMEIQKIAMGDDNPDFKDTVNELRNSRIELCKYYSELGQYEKALEHFLKAVELSGCKNNEERLDIILKYAFLYAKTGEEKRAFEILESAKNIILCKYGECSLQYADALRAEGKLLVETGNLPEGEKLLVKALETEFIIVGDKGRSIGEISVFMGNALLKDKKIDKAYGYFLKASSNDDDSVSYLGGVGLGMCEFERKDYNEAYKHFENVKNFMEKYIGTESLIFSDVTKKMAVIDEKNKDYEKAVSNMNLSVSIRRLIGDDSREYLNDLLKLAVLYKRTGKKTEALECMHEVSVIIVNKDGETADFADIVFKMAKLNAELKKYAVSETLLNKCGQIYKDEFGNKSDEYASVIYEKAKLFLKSKELEKADIQFEELKALVESNPSSKFCDSKYFKGREK